MFKKSSFKNVKNKFIGLCIAVGLLTSAFSGLTFNVSQQVSAYHSQSSSYFSDANFTAYTGSSPLKPSQWSLIENEGNFNSETMVGAIFNSKSPTTSYMKKYKVFNNPGLPTSQSIESSSNLYYSLALSAPYNAGGRFGYKPSTSKLTLNKDSFYSIEITLKTVTMDDTTGSDGYDESYASSIDSMASIYLDGITNLENQNDAKFEMIQSKFGKDVYNGWGTYIFYIATNQLYNNENLDLELWLGSKSQVSSGSVFFNNVKVYEMDQNTFVSSIQESNDYTKVIDLRSEINSTPIANANFNTTWTTGWEIVEQEALVSDIKDIDITTFKDSDYYKKHNLTLTDNPTKTNNRTSGDNKVLFMGNTESSYTAIQSTNEFTFKRQSYYKVSVWAWSNSGAKAYIALTNTTDDLDIADATIELVTSNSVGDSQNNGWTEYSFYVYGNKFQNVTAKMILALGSVSEGQTSGAKGYAYFDNITLQEINYNEFSENSTNSNCKTFNYNDNDADFTISNYSFDISQNKEHSNKYPLAPASWEYSETTTGENVTKSGIVNTHNTLFNGSEIAVEGASQPSNPGHLPYATADSYNNTLMIGSRFTSKQTYTSPTFSMEANSYYKLSVYVNATKGGAGIKVANTNGIVFEKQNITSQGWTNFVTYIRTGAAEESLTFVLSLNNTKPDTKYVFFDEVVVEKSSDVVYNSIDTDSNTTGEYTGTFTSKVDLLNYDFENFASDSYDGFTVDEQNDGKFAKVQNTSEEYGITAHSGNKALVVYSNDQVNGVNYLATTNRAYTISADSYYKVTVFVKTVNIQNGGATVKISGTNLDCEFYDINTDSANSNNWTEYTFFIKATTETNATVSLGLGNDTTKSSGYALFDDITFTKLTDEAEFNALTENLLDTQKIATVEDTSTEDDTTEDTTDDKIFEGSFNWFVVTSLITALSIIIAVVGVLLRKVNFKHSKKIKTQYDRRRTLDVSLDNKEKIARRKAEIEELERQLKEIEDEIAGIKKDVELEKEKFAAQHNEAKSVIEQRKQAITDEKEKALHDRNEKIAQNKNAFTREEEEKFTAYIKKLEKQEKKELAEIQKHDKAINNFQTSLSLKLQKSIARQEFIKAEIARIDAEIEAIAKEEAQIWEDYRLAKEDAKRRKAEYKAQQKALKQNKKTTEKDSSVESVETPSTQPEDSNTTTSTDNAEVEIVTPDEEK